METWPGARVCVWSARYAFDLTNVECGKKWHNQSNNNYPLDSYSRLTEHNSLHSLSNSIALQWLASLQRRWHWREWLRQEGYGREYIIWIATLEQIHIFCKNNLFMVKSSYICSSVRKSRGVRKSWWKGVIQATHSRFPPWIVVSRTSHLHTHLTTSTLPWPPL